MALAVAATFAAGTVAVQAKPVKCYGVSLKGKNDCGTKLHACAGQSTKDYDPTEWIYVKAVKNENGAVIEPAKDVCQSLKDKVAKLK
ncbi:BufA1 family periplasmic bufferin-type metallophore [Piscirickettsia litoralis]|uniref:BufA1 family periplasmic bufferin-type metallophore n=1 Tax=Piscirickettsia litoralis TaxID=1891921 RepID=UPI001F4595F0|nr:DUF2282 domain-containing protein [Piscirickettsia litoralis]